MIKLATVFSGIGAIEHALKRMNIDHKIVFACDNGDVDILSKTIDDEINSIDLEISNLEKSISLIKNLAREKVDIKKQLNQCKDKLEIQKQKIDVINLEECNNYIKNILTKIEIEKLKGTQKVDYSKLIKQFKSSNDNYFIIKVVNKILNDCLKENTVTTIKENKKVLKKSSFINWNSIKKEIQLLLEIYNKCNFKKIVSEIKEIREYLSMLHERINTLSIHDKLSKINTFKEKNKYINSLYKAKDSQNKVKQSYLANYNINEDDFHWNVSFLDGKQYTDEVDLFVGGSPCQSFSLVGKQRGLEDTRGTLFYEYARLVSEIKPKVFIYENVKALLSNDNGKTWEIMKKVFTDLNYTWDIKVLNAKDYGIPQNRERIFVVGFRNDIKLKQKFEYPIKRELEKKLQDFLIDNVSGKYYLQKKGVEFVTDEKNLNKKYTQIDGEISLCQKKNQQFNWHGDFVFVEENKDMEKTMQDLEKYFLSEKVEKYVMSSGTKGFYSKPKIDLEIARPLLTSMHKMHRAGVDNYVTTEGRIRKLTPRECLRLMGFCDSFKIEVSDTSMYQQAGNSIVVDVLMGVMDEILKCYDFNGEV